MSKKRMLADVLWEAANKRLSADGSNGLELRSHTCESVALELGVLWEGDWPQIQRHKALLFLKSLGCKTETLAAFCDFEPGPERQGVRYMWLLLAMHVAEDEGIEV